MTFPPIYGSVGNSAIFSSNEEWPGSLKAFLESIWEINVEEYRGAYLQLSEQYLELVGSHYNTQDGHENLTFIPTPEFLKGRVIYVSNGKADVEVALASFILNPNIAMIRITLSRYHFFIWKENEGKNIHAGVEKIPT